MAENYEHGVIAVLEGVAGDNTSDTKKTSALTKTLVAIGGIGIYYLVLHSIRNNKGAKK